MSDSTLPDLRRLAPQDLDGALVLSSTAGWNQRMDDWRMLLRIAPAGSFCAVAGGRIVATSIGIDYGAFGWIAMMLVEPAYRGRGLGARLLESALEAIPRDRPIRLDATPLGRPLYQRYDFDDEVTLTRHVASGPVVPPDVGLSPAVRQAADDDMAAVFSRDRLAFGGDRQAVLQWAFRDAPRCAQVATAASSASYCFGRQGRLFDQVGPVVADDDETAIALVSAAMPQPARRAIVVDAYESRRRFTDWLGACGFEPQRPLYRMRRPPRREPGQPRPPAVDREPLEYAILGPEFG